MQKEFILWERQSGKQDVVILIEDACERWQAGKGTLSTPGLWANLIIHISGGGGKDC